MSEISTPKLHAVEGAAPILNRWDKAALLTTGAAAAYKILLWQLGVPIDSPEPWAVALRAIFGVLSFVAFDLVLVAVVVDQRRYGWTWPGMISAVGAGMVSGLVALHVAGVWLQPWLHAAPAVTLLLFTGHLVLSRAAHASQVAQAVEPAGAPAVNVTQALQVNLQLPRTVADYVAERARQYPSWSHGQIANELGTSADVVRRALMARAAAAETADQVADPAEEVR